MSIEYSVSNLKNFTLQINAFKLFMQALLIFPVVSCVTLSPCSIISDISVLKLKVDKCSRQDNLFMKKVQHSSIHHSSPRWHYHSDLKSVGLHQRMHVCPKGWCCVDISVFSMHSICTDTFTSAVRSRTVCSLTLRSSTHSWPSSAWSWPTKRWWWTLSAWRSLCRYTPKVFWHLLWICLLLNNDKMHI